MWLVVVLPDGHPSRVPMGDTDLLGLQPRTVGPGTVLSVAGIRRLGEIAARWEQRAGSPGAGDD